MDIAPAEKDGGIVTTAEYRPSSSPAAASASFVSSQVKFGAEAVADSVGEGAGVGDADPAGAVADPVAGLALGDAVE